jgi:hypothetical protein
LRSAGFQSAGDLTFKPQQQFVSDRVRTLSGARFHPPHLTGLMDSFAGSDEVVRFEPAGHEDEAVTAQEPEYVNHVFMRQNPGFMVLYPFIKDALPLTEATS